MYFLRLRAQLSRKLTHVNAARKFCTGLCWRLLKQFLVGDRFTVFLPSQLIVLCRFAYVSLGEEVSGKSTRMLD